ncbi:hypothetical protein EDC96DRAFT_570391 [Choanephora cucurbitarum]|nr:hypothetical protein EDC96DRAFT_570391 [Choanephora cucurbitarum]
MTSLEHSEPDIMDIQDKIGYVDTGPIPSSLPSSQPIIVSNAHLTIKEPKPQRQVWMENKRPQPILIKKATPVEPTTLPEPKAPLASLKPTVSFTPSTKGKENSDELKDMMVSKLYELADMLKSMNMDQESVKPRPTASTSDPARFIRRKSVPYIKPPDLRRSLKSAESMFQHPQEPYYPHYYPPPTSQHYYPYYPYSAEESEVDELDNVDDPHLEDEDPYYHGYYPYYPYPHFDYEEDPRLPRHRYGPRRKSLGNLYEEHYYPTLQRKSSKSNLRRRQPTIDPRYDYPPHTTPRYRYPSYYSSPNGYYV